MKRLIAAVAIVATLGMTTACGGGPEEITEQACDGDYTVETNAAEKIIDVEAFRCDNGTWVYTGNVKEMPYGPDLAEESGKGVVDGTKWVVITDTREEAEEVQERIGGTVR